MKKTLALLLAAMILMTGCSESNNNENENGTNESSSEETTSSTTGSEESESETEETIPAPELPADIDWGGELFNIIYPYWSLYEKYLTSDELIGDAVNDAMFLRNETVEDKLNVELLFINKGAIGGMYGEIKTNVTSGDSSYGMAVLHCIEGLPGLLSDNLIYDWNKIPYVDLTKPYWNSSILEQLTIDGVTPFAASDLLIADPNVIWFNNDIATDMGIGNLYDIVFDGKWTLDEMIKLCDKVVVDLDGDGEMTDKDQYGICGNLGWNLDSFQQGCGQYIAEFVDGVPQIAIQTEKMKSIVDKVYALCMEGNRGYVKSEIDDRYIPFETYHALFYFQSLSSMERYRDTNVDYGIIPYPKYDEAQKEYLSLNWTGLQCIPVSCKNIELAGMVAEELGYENKKSVLPTYFDQLLDGKIARHDETRAMLDIIFDNCVYDFGLNFSNQRNFLQTIPDLLREDSTDLSSYVNKNLKVAKKVYERIISDFAKLGKQD